MATEEQYQTERSDVLARAFELPLLDAVAAIVYYNISRAYDRSPHYHPIDLGALEGLGSQDEIERAAERVMRLREGADRVVKVEYGYLPGNAATVRAEWKEAHPGFSEQSYHRAWGEWAWAWR